MAARPLNWLHSHRGYLAYFLLVGALVIGAWRFDRQDNAYDRLCQNRREVVSAFEKTTLLIVADLRQEGHDPALLDQIEQLVKARTPVEC